MKTYKTVRVPASEQKCVDKITCDLCGAMSPRGDSWSNDAREDVAETSVSMTLGWGSRDGGDKTTTLYDICPTCFKSKLMPWLEAQGAKPQTEHSDW